MDGQQLLLFALDRSVVMVDTRCRVEDAPTCYIDARKRDDADLWISAMQYGINVLERMKVWRLVIHSGGRRVGL